MIAPFTAATRQRLRLAVVTETWPPEVNGVALSLQRMLEGLRTRGHRVQLVRPCQPHEDRLDRLPEASDGLDHELCPGLPIPRYPGLRMGLPAPARLRRLWSAQPPDLVHVATEGPLGHSAVAAALDLCLPVSSDFRTNFHAYSAHYGVGWLRRPIMAVLRRFHNRCAFSSVPTAALQRELAADGFERLEVVSRGVDLRRFDPAHRDAELRRGWGAGDADPVALYVGRLAPEKNLALLADSWPTIAAAQPRARLVLVGDGPMRGELQARLPGAVFAGTRHGHDLAMHYASADLFLFPSRTETFGNVVIEAMASGLPVVAFQHAAAAELLEAGRNGAPIPLGHPGTFVDAARWLMAEPQLLRRLGRGALDTARTQDWAQVVDRLEYLMWRTVYTARASAAIGATGRAMARI